MNPDAEPVQLRKELVLFIKNLLLPFFDFVKAGLNVRELPEKSIHPRLIAFLLGRMNGQDTPAQKDKREK